MARAPPEAPATYFRLSAATWALIVEEYANGARAKELGAKWKVAPNSVYRQAAATGLTKRDCGDRRARAHAKSAELARRARLAREGAGPGAAGPDPALTTLFAPALVDDPDAGDPAALARTAILASGRAMKGRLWAEARALAGLAESYARLGDRVGARGGQTIETADLKLLFEVLHDDGARIRDRFWINGDDDPDLDIKTEHWRLDNEAYKVAKDRMIQTVRRAAKAEARVAELEAALGPIPTPGVN